ncbi:penicillin acylase family protein [Luteimonas gilva]|uniref:Penicillin acylase family protein n=1 Tax=Luteimonas gilva TaxID=2572684 RepID=A0A4U5JXA3_9GAMM|nr:penicillin acylase family protein [Luteimonas gilva]TKR32847.1 penicillin acylase family protein [Luteimonas gilva]
MVRWLKRIALLLVLIVLAAVITVWLSLRASLPKLEGEWALRGLSAPVTVQRDRLGVVTIDAANETDAMRALGYVHAQERFFEMDLMRRTAAGELSELFGPIALDTDKRHRIHRMRARATEHLDAIAGDKLPQLRAYAEGANEGLHALKARPWPYLPLRAEPEPWQPVDSLLTGYAMYFDLQDASDAREFALWRIKPHLPPALFDLIVRDGTRWDAPLMGRARGDATLPGPDQVDLRKLPRPTGPGPGAASGGDAPGSNNFAVAGALTQDGRAIVADDMHLGLRAPNIWFRVRLRYAAADAPGGKVDIAGFSLPGQPAIIVGSNGHIAWAFTNGYVDTMDWMRARPCSGDAAPQTCAQVRTAHEKIEIAGAPAYDFRIEETDWGPVLHKDADGTLYSLRWVAQRPEGLNLNLSGLAKADSVDAALRIADRVAIPAQNLLVADGAGRIAWRLLGALPARENTCPASMTVADGAGFTPPSQCSAWAPRSVDLPQLPDPASGRLWSANNRLLDDGALNQVGDSGYALGARAKQIRDGLFARSSLSERDLLAIQLDDRALLLTPWWTLLREQAARGRTPAMRELATAAEHWEGRASPQSVSYRIVRAWRLAVHARIAEGLLAPAQAALGDRYEAPDLGQLEGIAWPLVSQRPTHLLSRRYPSWGALFEDAAQEVRDTLAKQGPLAQRNWGEQNTAAICHPLAKAIPLIGKRLLCMPPDLLPGDGAMPRVQGPAFGASERMVVSPGHEADGIVHMPGGQSGHFLSPFWGAGHEDWVHGRPTPFLPGKTEYTLTLKPAR